MSKLQKFGDDEHARWLKERAACQMYEALKKLGIWLESHTSSDSPEDAIDYVRAVLAKAEGRS